jgi:predicted phosphate transport protein (TIGR00153 family)
MSLRLKPHERGFYPLFAEAGRNIEAAAGNLAALMASGPEGRPALATRVKEAERRGDELTREVLLKLNSTFVTPFDREDIYRLASSLDNVVDAIEEAADRIVLYRIGALPGRLVTQCDTLCRAARCTADAMGRLTTVSELGDYFAEINTLEDEADELYRDLISELLSSTHTSVGDLQDALKVKEVMEALEEAADAFETVAHTVEAIAVKET